jgi:hypothetical protein
MKLALAVVVGVILGGVGTVAVQRQQRLDRQEVAMPPPAVPAVPTASAQQQHPFELSRTRIICDREHVAFDAADYAYCQEIPKNAIRAWPMASVKP